VLKNAEAKNYVFLDEVQYAIPVEEMKNPDKPM
jgi:predicted AAA+ superfamily ATPase